MIRNATRVIGAVLGAMLFASVCLPAYAQEPTKWKALSEAESKLIDDKIASNWNIATDPAMSCATPLTFDVRMGPEGVVKEVVLINPKVFEAGDPCQSAADAAQRAIWKSSPLPVPNGSQRLKLNFDSSTFQ